MSEEFARFALVVSLCLLCVSGSVLALSGSYAAYVWSQPIDEIITKVECINE